MKPRRGHLETLLNQEKLIAEEFLLRLQGWPKVVIYFPVPLKQASISLSMMEALIELQNIIHRAHTFIGSNTGDLRNLTK